MIIYTIGIFISLFLHRGMFDDGVFDIMESPPKKKDIIILWITISMFWPITLCYATYLFTVGSNK